MIVEYLETHFTEKYRQPVPKVQTKPLTSISASTPQLVLQQIHAQMLKQKADKSAEFVQNTADYQNRKSRGDNRVIFNEKVARLPGLYNEHAKVDIVPLQTVDPYDFFNLNAVDRTNYLDAHF